MMLSPLSKLLLFSFLIIILNFSINNVCTSDDESSSDHPRHHTWEEKGKASALKSYSHEIHAESPSFNEERTCFLKEQWDIEDFCAPSQVASISQRDTHKLKSYQALAK